MSTLGVSALTTNAIGAIKGLTARKAYIQDFATSHTLVQIDASIREVHSIEAPPSEFPIESGQVIADNFIVKPFGLDMEGEITDNPINPIAAAATSVVSAIVPPTGIIAGATAVALFSALSSSKSPSVANFNQFLSMIINKRTLNVYTTLNFYKSMWISSLRVTRESKSGNSLEFTARFVQVILVQPQTVNVAKYANGGISAAQANLGKGQLDSSNIYLATFNNGMVNGVQTANSATNVIAP